VTRRLLPVLVAPGDQLDVIRSAGPAGPTRAQLMHMLRGRTATDLDPAVLAGLARTDGATVMDSSGKLLAVGAILLHTEPPEPHSNLAVEGARTTAAMAAGRHGPVLKVSEDGMTFYDRRSGSGTSNQTGDFVPGPYAVARGGPVPRSAPAGAPVARRARHAARSQRVQNSHCERITG
jgi:hypothetical protein